MPTRDQRLLHLNVEIEKLERRLKGFEAPLLPGQQRHEGAFERMIKRKKVLEAERERFLGTSPANNARPVTQAPPPITPLRGSWIPPAPKRTRAPRDLPPYYPNDLISQTRVIIAEAVREFADQTRTLELCKHVISVLTPLFRKAVESGILQAEAALSNSGMGGLLHYLLVHNCDNENERSRLEQEVMASDEWLMLEREIAEVSAELKAEVNWRPSKSAKAIENSARLLTHSTDYRTVTIRGEKYTLTAQQAPMIQILHEAYKDGNSDVSIAHILECLEKKTSRWQDTFKSNPKARKALVTSGERKGTLRLNL